MVEMLVLNPRIQMVCQVYSGIYKVFKNSFSDTLTGS